MAFINKKTCKYCGNNPVPHFFTWYFESINLVLSEFGHRVKAAFGFQHRPARKYHQGLAFSLFYLGRWTGLLSLNNERSKCKVRRAEVLWEDAERRGIKLQELKVFGRPVDCYLTTFPNWSFGKTRLFFNGLPRPANADPRVLELMDDKVRFKNSLLKEKLPVALGASVHSFAQAKNTFAKIQKELGKDTPVIVKPRTGSRGRHTSTFVHNLSELKQAFKIAKQLCFWVIVEEQFMGPVYRATVINYKLAGVLRGDSPQVLGDGKNTIRKLIELRNKQRAKKVSEIKITTELKDFLAKQNLKLNSVLAKGKLVNLSEKIGIAYGGSSREDFEICHPDNVQLFERAARVLGDPIVGFDFIIQDIRKSWKKQRCGFIEANSQPFINLHHDPLLGKPRNVAGQVWEMILKQNNGRTKARKN